MPRGHIDAITKSGYIEGWAYEPGEPLKPVNVVVANGVGELIARGLANLYREDLVDAGIGTGWASFRILSAAAAPWAKGAYLLIDVTSRTVLHANENPLLVEDPPTPQDLGEFISLDPTIISSISQLRGCGDLFTNYIDANGIDSFVRAGFVYVLKRPPDISGLMNYVALLRSKTITALEFIHALYESDEYRATPRPLAAPPTPAFPFNEP